MSEAQEPFETELLLLWGVHAEPMKIRGTFMKQWELLHCLASVRDFLIHHADLETIRILGKRGPDRYLSLHEYRRIIDQTFPMECSQEHYFEILEHFHRFVPYYIEQNGYIGYTPTYTRNWLRPYLLLAYALFIAPLDPKAGTAQIALQILDEAIRSYKLHAFGEMEDEMREAFLFCRYQMMRHADHPIFFSPSDLDPQKKDNEGKR